MESICRPIFLMIPLWLFFFFSFSSNFFQVSVSHAVGHSRTRFGKNGVSKMSLFTPQLVAIEWHTNENRNIQNLYESIAEIQANKMTCTHTYNQKKTHFFYWMWSILCHIYSIKGIVLWHCVLFVYTVDASVFVLTYV